MAVDQLQRIGGLEWQPSGEHLVAGHPERVEDRRAPSVDALGRFS